MDLEFSINREYLTHSGRPSITLGCADCNHIFIGTESYLYNAILSADPRILPEEACEEFLTKFNNKSVELFKKESTLRKFKKSICNCTKGVVNLDERRSINRAQELAKIGLRMSQESNVMNFAGILSSILKERDLHISFPELDWTFGNDNADSIPSAFASIEGDILMYICQFTKTKSDVPFESGNDFLPVKRIAAFILSIEDDEIYPLDKDYFESAYHTDAETGKQISKHRDLVFVNPEEMLQIIQG